MTPVRVALARMLKEAGLRSPRTQLTKVQIEISVQGRCTEASIHVLMCSHVYMHCVYARLFCLLRLHRASVRLPPILFCL